MLKTDLITSSILLLRQNSIGYKKYKKIKHQHFLITKKTDIASYHTNCQCHEIIARRIPKSYTAQYN